MARPMPAPPAVTRTRRPLAETSLSGDSELAFPIFSQHPGAEGPMRFAPHQLEAGLSIDGARGSEVGVRPQHHLSITARPGEGDALLDQPPAEARSPRARLKQEQPQFRDFLLVFDEKHATDTLAVHFRDPAALARRVEFLQEVLDDLGDQGLEARAPAVLLEVERRVALDHPA